MITAELRSISEEQYLFKWIIDRLDIFSAESADIAKIGIDRETVEAALLHKNVRSIFAFKDGVPIGVILFFVSNPWFNKNKKSISDLVMWVDKDHRGSAAFFRMTKVLEDIAEKEGVPFLTLSQSTGIDVAKTSKLFEKMGYAITGVLTLKEIKNVPR